MLNLLTASHFVIRSLKRTEMLFFHVISLLIVVSTLFRARIYNLSSRISVFKEVGSM